MNQALRSTPRASKISMRDALRWLRSLLLWGGFGLIVLLGARFLVRDSLKYLEWTEAVYLRFWPQRLMLATHVFTASLALVVAPLQFSATVRRRWPTWHRRIGWTYIVCALVSAPFSFVLGFYSSCRMCIPPFAIWAFLFFVVTALALLMAVRRQFDAHRQFMIRSWVLMNGFVVVRLDDVFRFPLPVGTEISRPAMIIWVAWVVPFVLTEMWLTWSPLVARSRRLSKSAAVA